MKAKVFAVRKVNEIKVRGAGGLTGAAGPKGDTGEQGATGPQGPQGNPGFSPTVSITEQGENYIISITDENGTHTATVAKGMTVSELMQAIGEAVGEEAARVDAVIAAINAKIPATASSSNQLATEDFVNSSINSVTAFFITYNAAGDPFPTKAALDSATTFYYAGKPRVPTKNDYCLVNADETHGGAACRYVLQEQNTEMVWAFQYKVNDTPFTAAQLAAINSGVTAGMLAELQNGKLDKVTSGSTRRVYGVDGNNSQVMFSIADNTENNTIPLRTTNGNIRVGIPTNVAHAANKGYVDALVGDIETILHSINSGNGGQA